MENNEPPVPSAPPAMPPPAAVPPVIPPPVMPPPPRMTAPAKPSGGGRGWKVLAIILIVLLGLSMVGHVRHAAHGVSALFAKAGKASRHPYEQQVIEDNDAKNKIVVIPVEGVISSYSVDELGQKDSRGQNMVADIKDQLDLAADNEEVKAVILKVDSPGGEVLASDEIYRALKDFQKHTGKPVVVSMGNLAASGGYYVSAPCRWIVANELTITGSIGVIMSGYNYRGLMDKVGVAPMVFKSGKFKDMLSPTKLPGEIAPEEKKMIQDLIDETFGKFKSIVAEGRGEAAKNNKGEGAKLQADWADYADGRILTGRQALELGFVDELGNFDTAYERACTIAGIDKANVVRYQQPFDFSNLFRLLGRTESHAVKIDLGLDFPKLQAGLPYFLCPTLIH